MKHLLFAASLLLVSSLGFAQDRPHCKGITKAGKPCQSVIVSKVSGYCRMHDPKAIHCAKTGCGMIVKNTGDYCRFHK